MRWKTHTCGGNHAAQQGREAGNHHHRIEVLAVAGLNRPEDSTPTLKQMGINKTKPAKFVMPAATQGRAYKRRL